jgi:hypothetical protein
MLWDAARTLLQATFVRDLRWNPWRSRQVSDETNHVGSRDGLIAIKVAHSRDDVLAPRF